MSLMGVLSQMLLPAQTGGRTMAMEIMMPNKAIRNLIREDKLHQIYSIMQTGQQDSGMQTMNQSLLSMVERRLITTDLAMEKSPEPEELEELIEKKSRSPMGQRAGKMPAPKRGA
jgi:twitching motility protein PilT